MKLRYYFRPIGCPNALGPIDAKGIQDARRKWRELLGVTRLLGELWAVSYQIAYTRAVNLITLTNGAYYHGN